MRRSRWSQPNPKTPPFNPNRTRTRTPSTAQGRDHHLVHVAQILGMADGLTLALAKSGYNTHKLVLFGDFFEIFPWMLRRVSEFM